MKLRDLASIVLVSAAALVSSGASATALDAAAISHELGVNVTTSSDGVVKGSLPRNDVAVTVDRVPLKPFAGLTTWAAFVAAPKGAMLMGDTVLFEDEVNAAMDAAFANGLDVTAIHNHFFFDSPKVYFMHIGGHGDQVDLAKGARAVWDAAKAVRTAHRTPAASFGGEDVTIGQVTATPLDQIFGKKGQAQGGMVKFSWGKEATMHGVQVGEAMGLNTWAAFTGNDELAVVDGDFIMTAAEVQPVLKALRKGGINVVALHNHMMGEDPAMFFTHFWAKGRPVDLAKSLKGALDAQAGVRQAH